MDNKIARDVRIITELKFYQPVPEYLGRDLDTEILPLMLAPYYTLSSRMTSSLCR